MRLCNHINTFGYKSHIYGNIAFYLYYLNYGDGVLWEYGDLFPL